MIQIIINKITIISMISIYSYRIIIVDFIVSVILIYLAGFPYPCGDKENSQMYDTISMFLASDINVYIEDKVIVKPIAYTISTLLVSTKSYIPWIITAEIDKAQQELTKIYNSLDKNSDLYKFITKHCKYLLQPLEGPVYLNLEGGSLFI